MSVSRAEELLSDALALPGDQRIDFITDACGDDAALRTELLSLLEHAAPAEALFETLAQFVIPDLPAPGPHAGRFEIAECIGVGGMGAVYRAYDARLERDVALKFMPTQRGFTDEEDRLLREARAVAALEHPNICTVHEIGETADGRSFIAMTLYDGETLRERLARGPLVPAAVLDIAIQAARGLSAAHAHGIVHGDVKPGNIMVTSAGIVKLLDFGLAATSGTDTRGDGVPGTVPYMSPEQIRGAAPGPQSDLWSLGVVVYEMLAGVRPFGGGEPAHRISSILNDTPRALRSINRRIPVSLERIVARLLERDPAVRYQTADELLHDLTRERAAYEHSIPALLQSRRARLSVLAVAVALLLGGTSVWWQLTKAPSGTASITVLPFLPAANDTAQQYFADGLRDELTTLLSGMQAMRVVGQGSAARFDSAPGNVQAIGRALQVGSVLAGSVESSGDSVHVHTELYNTADGRRLWTNTYRRPVGEVALLHHDIALGVATALGAPLSATERAQLTRQADVAPEAYASYLRGRYFWHQRTAGSYARAIEYFERALEHDSLFAPAHAGLASVYMQQGMAGQLPVAEAAARTRAAALRAVALADNSASAHSVLALYLHAYAWDSEAAEREFRRALDLEPDQPLTHHYYGTFLRSLRRLDEAIAHGTRAVELDPLVPGFSETLALTLLRAGRTEAAYEQIRVALELDSTYWRAHAVLGAVYESMNRTDDAVRTYQRANELAGPAAHRTTADLARVLALAGDEAKARQMLDTVRAVAARTGAYEAAAATASYAMDDDDMAFYWLETAYQQRQPHLRFLDGDPRFAPLARDPRFISLMQRVGVRR